MLDERNVGSAMHAETNLPAPESTVDIHRAVRTGRRRRRVRLAAGSGIAAVTAVALVGGFLGVQTLTGRDGGGGPGGVAASGGASATPSAAAGNVRAFDPTHRTIDVGWWPHSLPCSYQSVRVQAQELSRVGCGSASGTQGGDREVDVAVFTRDTRLKETWFPTDLLQKLGSDDGQPLPDPTTVLDNEPAGPAIGGHATHWVSGTRPDQAILTWQWAPKAWAFVHVKGFSGASSVVRRIARSVDTGVDKTVAMPFTTARPPSALSLTGTSIARDSDGSYNASLDFSDQPSMIDPQTRGSRYLSIGLESDNTRTGEGDVIPPPNTTLDGHPASVRFGKDYEYHDPGYRHDGAVRVYDVSGWMVEVVVNDDATAQHVDRQAATDLARKVSVISDHKTDMDGWTEHPIR